MRRILRVILPGVLLLACAAFVGLAAAPGTANAAAKSYPTGWSSIAAPSGTTVSYAAFHWDGSAWQVIPPGAPLSTGVGYFVYFPSPATVTFAGNGNASNSGSYSNSGWTHTGNPCALGDATLQVNGGTFAAYRFDPNLQQYQAIPNGGTVPLGESIMLIGGTSGGTYTISAPACGSVPPPPPPCGTYGNPCCGGLFQPPCNPCGGPYQQPCNPCGGLYQQNCTYSASITVDRGAGSLYHPGDMLRICYQLSPANIPFHVRITRYTGYGSAAVIFDGNDNGINGGDCTQTVVGTPAPDTRTLKFEAFINGSLVASAQVSYYVQ